MSNMRYRDIVTMCCLEEHCQAWKVPGYSVVTFISVADRTCHCRDCTSWQHVYLIDQVDILFDFLAERLRNTHAAYPAGPQPEHLLQRDYRAVLDTFPDPEFRELALGARYTLQTATAIQRRASLLSDLMWQQPARFNSRRVVLNLLREVFPQRILPDFLVTAMNRDDAKLASELRPRDHGISTHSEHSLDTYAPPSQDTSQIQPPEYTVF